MKTKSVKIGWILMLILGLYRTAAAIIHAIRDIGDLSAKDGRKIVSSEL